jgi:hypothetical protein
VSWCPNCAKDVGAVVTFGADTGNASTAAAGIVKICTSCGNKLPQDAEPHGSVPQAQVIPIKRPHGAVPTAAPMVESADILGMVRARLTWLGSETARLRGLELEAKRLRKMLAAADRMEPK